MIGRMHFMHIPELGQRESLNGFPLFFLLVYMLKFFLEPYGCVSFSQKIDFIYSFYQILFYLGLKNTSHFA